MGSLPGRSPRPTSAAGLALTTEDEAVVLFLSGLHGPSVTAFLGHARMLAERGCASLLKVRAHGRSEGDRIALGFHGHHDVRGAVDHLRPQSRWSKVPLVAFGPSMGREGGERLGKRGWSFRP